MVVRGTVPERTRRDERTRAPPGRVRTQHALKRQHAGRTVARLRRALAAPTG